jgi:hypothetical protein
MLFSYSGVFADPGHVIIHVTDLSEKKIESLNTSLASETNIVSGGVCPENKLLLINLQVFDDAHVRKLIALLKKEGIVDFHMKEEVSIDRFLQNCNNFIHFTF